MFPSVPLECAYKQPTKYANISFGIVFRFFRSFFKTLQLKGTFGKQHVTPLLHCTPFTRTFGNADDPHPHPHPKHFCVFLLREKTCVISWIKKSHIHVIR